MNTRQLVETHALDYDSDDADPAVDVEVIQVPHDTEFESNPFAKEWRRTHWSIAHSSGSAHFHIYARMGLVYVRVNGAPFALGIPGQFLVDTRDKPIDVDDILGMMDAAPDYESLRLLKQFA